jgi:hypothetical protein
MNTALPIPDQELAELCRRSRVHWLAVFGSGLTKDFGPQSDVDLLVDLAPEARVGFLTLSQMARELSALLGRPVDLVPRSGLKPAIRETVLRKAQVIYAARTPLKKGCARAMRDTWTPLRRHLAYRLGWVQPRSSLCWID